MQNESKVVAVTTDGEVKTTELTTTPVEIDFAQIENQLAKISEMKRGLSVTPQYKDFANVGDKTRGIFLGFKPLSKKQKDGSLKFITCAVWVEEDKSVWCNGGVSFISGFLTQMADGTTVEMPKGTPFEAELINLKPAAEGKTKIYSIYKLA